MIPFLERGHYYGVENHLGALAGFAAYECVVHDLIAREPNLLFDDEFRIDCFGVTFDVILDFNVSVHLPMPDRERLFARLAASCTPGSRLFMPRKPKVNPGLLSDLGFELVRRGEVEYPVLTHCGRATLPPPTDGTSIGVPSSRLQYKMPA